MATHLTCMFWKKLRKVRSRLSPFVPVRPVRPFVRSSVRPPFVPSVRPPAFVPPFVPVRPRSSSPFVRSVRVQSHNMAAVGPTLQSPISGTSRELEF